MAVRERSKLAIVGCGPGSPDYLTEAGRRAIGDAAVLAGAPRLLDTFAAPDQERISFNSDIDSLLEAVAARLGHGNIAVLVSGDPGLSSLAGPVLHRFGREVCEVVPGISSVQLAFARLGLDWGDARIVCAHKEIPALTPEELAPSTVIAILTGHPRCQQWVTDLADALGDRTLIVGEDLSLPEENIRRVSVAEFHRLELAARTVVLLLKEGGS